MTEISKASDNKHSKTKFLTAFTVLLETGANRVKNEDWRTILTAAVPVVALIVTYGCKMLLKMYKCDRSIKLWKGYITEIKNEIDNPKTTTNRRKEASKELQKLQNELKQFEKDFIGFEVD